MNNQDEQIILITGGAKGIGRSMVELFLLNGARVIVVDNNHCDLEKIENILNSNMLFTFLCDVSDSNSVRLLISELDKNSLIPNVLINNAGYGGPFQDITNVSDDEWDKVVGTNLKGVFNFSKAIIPFMKSSGFGRIVNIASIQGLIGANLSSTYVATKHGVIGYTKSIASEFAKFGITCNAVCPGYVQTDMGAQDSKVSNHYNRIIERTPLGRLATPLEIAYLVEFLVSSKASFINGSIIAIDGGLMSDIGIT